ncbi:MAG: type II toxin-antitoxin system RelE/ParE family toxin [Acidobacteriota bacterium]
MSERVRILRRARRDLLEIQQYIARDAPEVADRVVDQLVDSIESLSALPLRGAIPRDARLRSLGFRFLLLGSHLVFSRVVRSEVRVYRVLHGKRAYAGIL